MKINSEEFSTFFCEEMQTAPMNSLYDVDILKKLERMSDEEINSGNIFRIDAMHIGYGYEYSQNKFLPDNAVQVAIDGELFCTADVEGCITEKKRLSMTMAEDFDITGLIRRGERGKDYFEYDDLTFDFKTAIDEQITYTLDQLRDDDIPQFLKDLSKDTEKILANLMVVNIAVSDDGKCYFINTKEGLDEAKASDFSIYTVKEYCQDIVVEYFKSALFSEVPELLKNPDELKPIEDCFIPINTDNKFYVHPEKVEEIDKNYKVNKASVSITSRNDYDIFTI